MSASTFADLVRHIGHKIEVVTYGTPPVNAAVECADCYEVLLDFDRDDGAVACCDICGYRLEDYAPDEWRCGACVRHYGDEQGNPPECDCHTTALPRTQRG